MNAQLMPRARAHASLSRMATQPVALTVAGTDPCGGAGIQADLKTFAALGVYGFSAVAIVVAQNSSRVLSTVAMEPEMVSAQIGALMMQLRPHAMKTGALGEPGIVVAVARAIEDFELPRAGGRSGDGLQQRGAAAERARRGGDAPPVVAPGRGRHAQPARGARR